MADVGGWSVHRLPRRGVDIRMAIHFLATVYIDRISGKYSPVATDTTVHDVVRIVEGDIESNLQLLCYRVSDTFPLLTEDRILRSTAAVERQLTGCRKRSTGSFLVVFGHHLYGMVIRDGDQTPK